MKSMPSRMHTPNRQRACVRTSGPGSARRPGGRSWTIFPRFVACPGPRRSTPNVRSRARAQSERVLTIGGSEPVILLLGRRDDPEYTVVDVSPRPQGSQYGDDLAMRRAADAKAFEPASAVPCCDHETAVGWPARCIGRTGQNAWMNGAPDGGVVNRSGAPAEASPVAGYPRRQPGYPEGASTATPTYTTGGTPSNVWLAAVWMNPSGGSDTPMRWPSPMTVGAGLGRPFRCRSKRLAL